MKAELLKKQQESSSSSSQVAATKADSYIASPLTLSGSHKLPRPTASKAILNARQNKGLEKRLQRDLEHHKETGVSSKLEASWVALQRKTKLYEQWEEEGTLDAEKNEGMILSLWVF